MFGWGKALKAQSDGNLCSGGKFILHLTQTQKTICEDKISQETEMASLVFHNIGMANSMLEGQRPRYG
jgi:hypothetical protein